MDNTIWKDSGLTISHATVYDNRPWWKRIFNRSRVIMIVNFQTGETIVKKWWGWKII